MTDARERLLVFEVHGNRYALALNEVAEVLEPQPTFPIPRSPRFFCGAINFHSHIVAVLDLAALFDIGSLPPGGKIVVLDGSIANLALGVGPTVDIVPVNSVLEEEAGNSPLVGKVLVMADGEVQLLSLANLLQTLEGGFSGAKPMTEGGY
jgi:purine-binding chemotaxis protein CheW